MPSYQFPIEAAQIALFVRAAGGADVDVSDPDLSGPPTFVQSGAQFDPVTTRNGAGDEVLAGYVTARVGQQAGGQL
jgi:hypothetical protein